MKSRELAGDPRTGVSRLGDTAEIRLEVRAE